MKKRILRHNNCKKCTKEGDLMPQSASKEDARLLGGDVRKAILIIAIPTILGLLASSIYHLADALFVAKLGTDASAAVGVTFALQTLLQAFGYTFGTGGGSLLSRSLGKNDLKQARSYATLAFILSLVIGSAITFLGLIFENPLLRLLGTTESSMPFALSYWKIFLWAAPAICANFTMSQLLRAEGHAMYAMWGLVIGNLLNILLDPFFIFTCSMGISGAAWATVIGQWIAFACLLLVYVFKKSKIAIFERLFHPNYKLIRSLLIAGAPSLMRQGLIFFATLLINRTASQIGEYALTSMSITGRMFLFAFSFCAGIGQGMMSVVGYHCGAENNKKMHEALKFAIVTSTACMTVISIPLYVFAPRIIAWFENDIQLITFATPALRCQMAVLGLHGVITCAGMYLQAIGESTKASFVAAARQGLFFLPLIIYLPIQFGYPSFRFVQPLADAFSFAFSLILLFPFLRFHEKNSYKNKHPRYR